MNNWADTTVVLEEEPTSSESVDAYKTTAPRTY